MTTMKEYIFINRAKEQFKFFINEDNNVALNVNYEKELIASFILNKEEVKELRKFLKQNP